MLQPQSFPACVRQFVDRARIALSDWLDPRPIDDAAGFRPIPNNFKFGLDEIEAMSDAIRVHGQPESEGFKGLALVALNALRADEDNAYRREVEIVARAMAQSANPAIDIDRKLGGGSVYANLPVWMSYVEYARPAVAAYRKRSIQFKPGQRIFNDRV